MTRRAFVQAAAAPILVAPQQGLPPQVELTVAQLVDRIRAAVGPWREKTIDGFKAGDASVALTGVAVTVAARLENLRRAASAGCNLVLTQEPVFYTANDDPGGRVSDAVYVAKKDFIDQTKLVIWRFSDHWNTRQPDPRVTAIAQALAWKDGPGTDNIYRIPETSLSSLMGHVRQQLGLRGGMRTVGPADMRVRTVLVSPGTTDLASTMAGLKSADVVLAGEPREWEVVPYVLDARAAGASKALISIGRIASEEPGMRACAAWIRTLAPGVRVEALPVSDPFWNPAS